MAFCLKIIELGFRAATVIRTEYDDRVVFHPGFLQGIHHLTYHIVHHQDEIAVRVQSRFTLIFLDRKDRGMGSRQRKI